MFESFRNFITEFVDGEKHPSRFADDDYRLAAAALLVHAAAIDGEMSQSERDKLHAVIKQRFDLDDAATDELVDKATAAEHEIGRPLSFHQPAQPRARRAGPRPHHRNDVGDRLCRRPARRARRQPVVARRRPLGVSQRERIELRQRIGGTIADPDGDV